MNERLDHVRTQDARLVATFGEASKVLIVLNSGAVATMLAFSQALIGRGQFSSYKWYALTAVAMFIAGAFTGGTVFHQMIVRIMNIAQESVEKLKEDTSIEKMATRNALCLAFFALGATIFLLGLVVCY